MYARQAATEADRFDLFISHASEDKKRVVQPLTQMLVRRGLTVWLDERQLTIGDSLSSRIEAGLAHSRFGVVVISRSFVPKQWPQRELAGLNAREVSAGTKVILPVWHEVDQQFVTEWFPILADRLGARTSEGLENVADQIALAFRRAEEAGPSTTQPRARAAPSGRARGFKDRFRRLGGVGLLAALVATVGFAVAPGGPSADSSTSLPNSVSTPTLEVSLPANWRRSSTAQSTPGLKLAKPLTLSSPTGSVLVLGVASSASPTLLPSSLLAALPTRPRAEAVRVGGMSFYRYRNLMPRGTVAAETVYAQPTTAGILVGVCLPGRRFSGGVAVDCERILGSMNLLAASPLELGPQPSYAVALSRVLSQLNAARARFGRKLLHAKSAASQADAAQQLASAHELAAASLRTASPGPAEQIANTLVITRLSETADGYTGMVTSARAQDKSGFDRARAAVAAGTARTSQAVARLSSFGYLVAR